MATAEPSPPSGPQYAPDDPTLPKPWKGLINGTVLYYWNPETNITQYEKPAAPPLPLGPPPVATQTTPSATTGYQQGQLNGAFVHQGLQMMQATQQQGQQINLLQQQHGQVIPEQQGPQTSSVSQQQRYQTAQTVQQQGYQVGPSSIQQGPLPPHQIGQPISQHPGPQMPHQLNQNLPQQMGQQMPQHEAQQGPQQMGQQTPQQQGSQMAHSQGHQYMPQQLQYFSYQQTVLPQRPEGMQQQGQHIAQAQPFLHQQEHKAVFSQREEVDLHQGSRVGISPQQIQQPVTSSVQMTPVGAQSGQLHPFSGTSINLQQPTSSAQVHQRGNESIRQQHGPMFQNQISPATMRNQQPNVPPGGIKMGFEDNMHERVGNGYYFNPNKDGPVMAPQQPKLAAIPTARNQQDMRMGIPIENVAPGRAGGGLSAVAGPNMPNLFSHASDGPAYSNNSLIKQPSSTFGSSDISNLSPVEVYLQQHEVTATGDNVPAPFMTFEATGFPPEILREVRYLLQRRSICRTLLCFAPF